MESEMKIRVVVVVLVFFSFFKVLFVSSGGDIYKVRR